MQEGEETIAAIATPVGQAGIGIVRLSGPRSLSITSKIFRPRKGRGPLRSHRLYLGELVDPATAEPLDEVLVSYMKAPRSYTREDVVEINCHSGYVLLSKILELLLSLGARPARPGEFTLRAFLNGRIDLSQAEAVVDLINAKSEKGLALASQQIRGAFRDRIADLKSGSGYRLPRGSGRNPGHGRNNGHHTTAGHRTHKRPDPGACQAACLGGRGPDRDRGTGQRR